MINLDCITKVSAAIGGGMADEKSIESEIIETCKTFLQQFVPDITIVSLQTE